MNVLVLNKVAKKEQTNPREFFKIFFHFDGYLFCFLRLMVESNKKNNMQKGSITTEKVHNLIILDESGSMGSIQSQIIPGFNQIVNNIKAQKQEHPNQQHTISFISFNSQGIKNHHFMDDVDQLQTINTKNYQPNGGTPLFDAMGHSLNRLRTAIVTDKDTHVFVTVLTDGAENASKEYSGSSIRRLIEDLKELNWTFTYIGADHDVEAMAENIAINNYMSFDKSSKGMEEMFAKEQKARRSYITASDKSAFKSHNMFEEPAEQPRANKINWWKKITGK